MNQTVLNFIGAARKRHIRPAPEHTGLCSGWSQAADGVYVRVINERSWAYLRMGNGQPVLYCRRHGRPLMMGAATEHDESTLWTLLNTILQGASDSL